MTNHPRHNPARSLALAACAALGLPALAQPCAILHAPRANPGDRFGASLAQVGDINGDGQPELVVGAPNAAIDHGQVWVLRATGESFYPVNDGFNDPFSINPMFGTSIGVTTWYGRKTLIVGSPGWYFDQGMTSIVDLERTYPDPRDPYFVFGQDSDYRMGATMASLGPPGPLGMPEFVGQFNSLSEVFAFGSLGPLSNRFTMVYPDTGTRAIFLGGVNEQLGASFATVGDLNADGIADVAVGAPGHAEPGEPARGIVYIVSGASLAPLAPSAVLIRTLAPNTSGANRRFGQSLLNVGDIDGDTIPDLAVAAPASCGQACAGLTGRIEFFSGATGAFIREAASPVIMGGFGASLALVADLNSDGQRDVAVGAPTGAAILAVGNPAEWTTAPVGEVAFVSPMDGSLLGYLTDDQAGGQFGFAVLDMDDTNANSTREILIGAPALAAVGSVRLFDPSSIHAITISSQPADVVSNANASFTVAATSSQSLTFQWHGPSGPLVDGGPGQGATVSGAQSAALSLTGLSGPAYGAYYCVIGDGCTRSVTRAAALSTP